MRRTQKKLTLNRETLVELSRADLPHAAGGTAYTCPSYTCQPPCDFSNGRHTCLTCGNTCTTNLC